VALAVADDGSGGESGWKECGDWLDEVKDLSEQRKMAGGAVMASLQAGVEVEVDVLEAEGGEEKECGEDLACAAGGEPAVDPDQYHAGEEDVGKREGGEHKRCPGSERWVGDGYADVGGDDGEGADDGGGAEEAEDDARGEVAWEAEGKADDGVDVEAEAGWGEVEDDEHPEGEEGPGEDRKHRDAAGGDEEVRAEASADDGSEGDDAEDREEDNAGGEFAATTFAAEGVAEDVPAEFGESGELGATLGGGPAVWGVGLEGWVHFLCFLRVGMKRPG